MVFDHLVAPEQRKIGKAFLTLPLLGLKVRQQQQREKDVDD